MHRDFTGRDHPGNPGRVSGSGPVTGHTSVHIKNSAIRSSCSHVILGTLRFREVELTTLNKVLLGRQPKLFDVFLSVV